MGRGVSYSPLNKVMQAGDWETAVSLDCFWRWVLITRGALSPRS